MVLAYRQAQKTAHFFTGNLRTRKAAIKKTGRKTCRSREMCDLLAVSGFLQSGTRLKYRGGTSGDFHLLPGLGILTGAFLPVGNGQCTKANDADRFVFLHGVGGDLQSRVYQRCGCLLLYASFGRDFRDEFSFVHWKIDLSFVFGHWLPPDIFIIPHLISEVNSSAYFRISLLR